MFGLLTTRGKIVVKQDHWNDCSAIYSADYWQLSSVLHYVIRHLSNHPQFTVACCMMGTKGTSLDCIKDTKCTHYMAPWNLIYLTFIYTNWESHMQQKNPIMVINNDDSMWIMGFSKQVKINPFTNIWVSIVQSVCSFLHKIDINHLEIFHEQERTENKHGLSVCFGNITGRQSGLNMTCPLQFNKKYLVETTRMYWAYSIQWKYHQTSCISAP